MAPKNNKDSGFLKPLLPFRSLTLQLSNQTLADLIAFSELPG
jgi:hypothetical protein